MKLAIARQWLREARSVAVLTGAGISAESGVPTFRGEEGLWRKHRPEDLATPGAFRRNPRLLWEWYDTLRTGMKAAVPNPAHLALVDLERTKAGFTLITQNIDGLHDAAGSANPLKLHGDIWRLRCTVCGEEWPDSRAPLPELPPRCRCGGVARPAIVWFGEAVPDDLLRQAQAAAETAEVFLVIGTAAAVYPAAGLVPLAHQSGARVIEINLAETPFSGMVDCSLLGKAGEIVPQLR
jgi:NAD-dependent deacetylase